MGMIHLIHRYRTILYTALSGAALIFANPATGAQRSAADQERDVHSKPDQVMAFVGVEPGWRVLDLFAGNGYYSEVLSQAVGPQGKVYMHNNQAYMGFAKEIGPRLKNNRLANVELYPREIEDIDLPSNNLDLVMLVMSYHDVYFEQNGWTVTVGPLMRTIHRVLKPGGVLVVIDHHAQPGSGKNSAQNLHRIDAEFAQGDIERFKFELIASSDLLTNPEDDLDVSVFDERIKGKTSKFLMTFRKLI